MNEEIGFEHKGIGDMLAHNRLRVPLNQREYSWEDEHVRDLLSDFANAIANNKATYFLGTIVLTRGDGEIPEVSDGQQRLATTTILLAAIRDYFFRNNDHLRAQSIETDCLQTTDINTTETVPKLRLNVDDNEFFKKRILANPSSPDRQIPAIPVSHKKIARAAEIAAQHVRDILEPYNEVAKTQRLLEWVRFVRSGAQVIILRVPDHLNAFMMFETLNDRGLKASQADLLKNHLLSYANEQIAEAQQRWARTLGVLESLGQGDIMVSYLHHLLITMSGPTKEREVFDKVRQFANSQSRALEFLSDLSGGANDYAALFNSDHKKWNEYGTSTRKHIATINRDLRVAQIRPLMLAVARNFSVKEAQKVFRLFVAWSVRFLIVGGRGGLLDRNYALRAQDIGDKQIKTAEELTKAMIDIIPSDALFETAFSEARVSLVHLARYYLRALELKAKGDSEPEWVPMEEEQFINIEHNLPQNPQAAWPDIDPETADVYYKRIGNMVILQARRNSIIGNSPFAEKKLALGASTFTLTSETAAHDAWGVNEIDERQKRLAKLAVETWPIKY
ncbi:MAG: DUF262 domain-containing HNH endonuclease family protein [Pseudomonadota bacterium]|nr:DUF262 domain-containing protein [Gammaproteobacteria bacterium]MDQ3580166.1 DUF262 domain-containing HNH endonuclease family protein [Pseudomonadota bacterium]